MLLHLPRKLFLRRGIFNTGIVAAPLGGILAASSLIRRAGNSRTIQIIVSTVVLEFVVGWLISLALHTVKPFLYEGWS